MTREQLEHIIRAAAQIADDDEIVIIGSQAILGQFPNAPPELLVSMEADVFPKNKTDRSDLIDGSIGELSPFHETFGYYAQGVGENTAVLPTGWRSRLIPVKNENTRGVTGWCLEAHDLVVAKAVAGREKDLRFIRVAIEHALVKRDVALQRLRETPIADEKLRAAAQSRIEAPFGR